MVLTGAAQTSCRTTHAFVGVGQTRCNAGTCPLAFCRVPCLFAGPIQEPIGRRFEDKNRVMTKYIVAFGFRPSTRLT